MLGCSSRQLAVKLAAWHRPRQYGARVSGGHRLGPVVADPTLDDPRPPPLCSISTSSNMYLWPVCTQVLLHEHRPSKDTKEPFRLKHLLGSIPPPQYTLMESRVIPSLALSLVLRGSVLSSSSCQLRPFVPIRSVPWLRQGWDILAELAPMLREWPSQRCPCKHQAAYALLYSTRRDGRGLSRLSLFPKLATPFLVAWGSLWDSSIHTANKPSPA